VRVRFNGKKAEARLYHAEINEKELLLWDKRTMRLVDPKHMVNKLINSVQKEFDDFILLNTKSLKNYSSNSIRDLLFGRNQTADPTVLDYMEKYYSSSIENNSNLSIGTRKNYIKANRHLKKFLTERKSKTFW
jgi:hypothetical protein